MRIGSHPEAELELEAAALWYEEKQTGLGDDFLDEFAATLRRIVPSQTAGEKSGATIANSTSNVFLTPSFTQCA